MKRKTRGKQQKRDNNIPSMSGHNEPHKVGARQSVSEIEGGGVKKNCVAGGARGGDGKVGCSSS